MPFSFHSLIKSAALHPALYQKLLRAALVVTVLFVALLNFVPAAENDVWLQIKIGQLIWTTGEIPRTLLFPFTWAAQTPFNLHELLPSLVFYAMDSVAGRGGWMWFQGAIALAQFALCAWVAKRWSGSWAVALGMAALAMLLANYRYRLRPEIFVLAYLVLLLHVLMLFRAGGAWRGLLWALPIALVWANSHGSFVFALAIAGVFGVGEAVQRAWEHRAEPIAANLRASFAVGLPYAALVLAMAALSLLNPMGHELLTLPFLFESSQASKTYIFEWLPTLSPWFRGRIAFAIFCAVLVLLGALLWAYRRAVGVTDLLLLLVFGALAFERNRFVALFGFVALVVGARLVGSRPLTLRAKWLWLVGALALGLIGSTVVAIKGNAYGGRVHRALADDLSEPIVSRLAQPSMQGNMLTSYELGAEVLYRAWPRIKPHIDSRLDSYGDDYFYMTLRLINEEDFRNAFVKDFDVKYMLLMERDFALMRSQPTTRQLWDIAYFDARQVLLVKKP